MRSRNFVLISRSFEILSKFRVNRSKFKVTKSNFQDTIQHKNEYQSGKSGKIRESNQASGVRKAHYV